MCLCLICVVRVCGHVCVCVCVCGCNCVKLKSREGRLRLVVVVVASGVVVGFHVSGVGDVSVAWRLVAA